jgi:hypothetical protein
VDWQGRRSKVYVFKPGRVEKRHKHFFSAVELRRAGTIRSLGSKFLRRAGGKT